MPRTLSEEVCARDNLLNAWESVRSVDLEDGRRSTECAEIDLDLQRTLDRLAARLRDGTWNPAPVRRIDIEKPTGGTRTLGIPPALDRVAERAVVQALVPRIDPLLSPWSFAFRPGLGVRDALRSVAPLRDEGATRLAFPPQARAATKTAALAASADPFPLRRIAKSANCPMAGSTVCGSLSSGRTSLPSGTRFS